jgi:cellulose synthase/poly-beta-1,6-N-acetylglucosamine synthase-like glycosyltransferase
MTVVAVVFWVSVALILYTQVGYGLLLALIARLATSRVSAGERSGGAATELTTEPTSDPAQKLPKVSLIVAAYNEADVIGQRIANLRALDYPARLVEIIVASDGSTDSTAAHARAAGADVVLELVRGGKIRAQDASVDVAAGDLLAFSDANSEWQPDALGRLVGAFADPAVGYVCGDVSFIDPDGSNQEGVYWRYEMWLRRLESGLRSVTSGNGAIYATRREAYLSVDPLAGHDLSFPFNMVKRGWRAVYATDARATEKMAPSIESEFSRKRRMARRTWPTIWGSGLISPRGYDPLYALMIFSHRLLRYLAPFLHGIALVTSLVLTGHGWVYVSCAAAQVVFLLAALLAPLPLIARLPERLPVRRAMLIARYYLVTNWALAVGLWDWLRGERSPHWETVEGTR